jgi:hypothetical protein
MKYTIDYFHQLDNAGLVQGVIDYMFSEGSNKGLAENIQKRALHISASYLQVDLKTLVRCMGYEGEGLTFSEPLPEWNKRVSSLVKAVQDGYIPAPLIVTDFWGESHLSDGNHRCAALIEAGITHWWVVDLRKISKKE